MESKLRTFIANTLVYTDKLYEYFVLSKLLVEWGWVCPNKSMHG